MSTSAGLRPCLWRDSEASPAGLPPSMMSVPRPAMFVAIVTAPVRPGLGDDARLLLVELGVEDLVLDAAPLEHRREDLGLLDADRADQDRPAGLAHLDDLVDERVELGVLVAEDEVRVVLADHLAVGRDGHDLELVDLVELLGLGHRRAGHAGQLVVQAEVVLEGDRGQRHALALDAQALLGLDGLVQALAPAPAGHLAAGELVDDDDLAVLDDVVAVALVERVGPQRLLEVAGQPRVGVVQVLDPSNPSILSMPSSVGLTAWSLRSMK